MKSSEIRQRFLDFFAEQDHKVLPSAPLVPQNDPTLLWINAGMAPFKDYFSGSATPPKRRVVTAQKCIRTNDIENVGQTARHQTFFEMLGNFSFGDYFKEEAIQWSYQFLTEKLNLDSDRFLISIYKDDDDAFNIWHKRIGIPTDRIIRMGKDENFWEIGTGPCGPCSEIHYDRGKDYGCEEGCELGCDCDRYLEIWNLVFTQYNKTETGEYLDLPQKNIDTGAGLERLASLLQDKPTNFETDLFMPIIEYITSHCGVEYGQAQESDVAIKVIADHIRSVSFAITDGVLPSNEGRGYVVRRLLRRAVRYAKMLDLKIPFLHTIVAVVVEIMGDHYTALASKQEQIEKIIKQEELRFQETLEQGMDILEDLIDELQKKDKSKIPGKQVFTLYDTYGFPKELTKEIAAEKGFVIDEIGFEEAMEEQRKRAREAREDYDQGHGQLELFKAIRDQIGNTQFVGYDNYQVDSKVLSLVQDEEEVKEIGAGQKAKLVLAKTPFYAEGGGQVGDQGMISFASGQAKVLETEEIAELIVHHIQLEEGEVKVGTKVKASINQQSRKATARNHTATHLLHKALKEILGDHVNQSGSLVTPDKLRFDFSHFEAVTEEELAAIEKQVNNYILKNISVKAEKMDLEEAKAVGATALFGDKYGEQVRLVKAGEYSKELCGGTHVRTTGEIGQFKIVGESGIAAGVRRIEAVTGEEALKHVNQLEDSIVKIANKLKANPSEVVSKVELLQNQIKKLEGEIESLKDKLAASQTKDLVAQVEKINGVPTILHSVDSLDAAGLRKMADELKTELDSGIIVLGSKLENKVLFVAVVTDDLVKEGYHAGEIIGEVAKVAGGGGGGRPNMAQAGGSKPEQLAAALEKAQEIIGSNV
ncbi:alanine--tRNA ligase [Halobacteroides halobius DSM 5150]|uniref:Alanine--tRNA ligase n=1 Tax=Halobacteroides halobius (strain ATCC 35273 / DSM 5150 / MD-1) TaxID=748449 RepID=L0K9J7_HALHC|nr:alanine--tRNA ligase [Halobacteroides halobius]AGB41962.1 alanine--tRNA ligase [Halobacteroides halobius DSM 5150]